MCVSSIELAKVVLDNIRLRVPRHIPQFLAEIHESHFIGCDQDRAAQFQKEFGPLTDDDEAKQFTVAARDVLSSAKAVLDKLGIRFWISSGTCLGEWYSTIIRVFPMCIVPHILTYRKRSHLFFVLLTSCLSKAV